MENEWEFDSVRIYIVHHCKIVRVIHKLDDYECSKDIYIQFDAFNEIWRLADETPKPTMCKKDM
jgi:hypothetical protein